MCSPLGFVRTPPPTPTPVHPNPDDPTGCTSLFHPGRGRAQQPLGRAAQRLPKSTRPLTRKMTTGRMCSPWPSGWTPHAATRELKRSVLSGYTRSAHPSTRTPRRRFRRPVQHSEQDQCAASTEPCRVQCSPGPPGVCDASLRLPGRTRCPSAASCRAAAGAPTSRGCLRPRSDRVHRSGDQGKWCRGALEIRWGARRVLQPGEWAGRVRALILRPTACYFVPCLLNPTLFVVYV